jgi:hypothetical protein
LRHTRGAEMGGPRTGPRHTTPKPRSSLPRNIEEKSEQEVLS